MLGWVSLIFYSLKRRHRACWKRRMFRMFRLDVSISFMFTDLKITTPTKQKVATGDLNITHFPVESKVAIHSKQGPTKILAYSDFFLEA
jgi:hypothetical protein